MSRNPRRWISVCSLALVLPLSAPAQSAEPNPGTFLHNGVTAHRGNSAEFPENTLPAFQSAIELGVDWLELDIFRTQDGQLVVIHDRTTGRVGDQDLDVAASTFTQLKTVDVATGFRRRHGLSIDDCPVRRIPLLEDVLHLVMKQRKTRVSIQPKMDCVADAVALVRRLKAEPWVGFNDGNLAYMSQVKRLAPELPVFWDRGDSPIQDDLDTARKHGFEALVLRHDTVTREKVQQIKAAGLEVGAWTVNDRSKMNKLLDLGVERIYTDRPRLLLALHAARPFQAVACEGRYRYHLQGVCTNDRDALYWSFTDVLVKTDARGRVLKCVDVANHHGDLCHHDGRIYVAVNLGRFNRPAGQADSWVYVYAAETLEELARHKTPEVVHGAGGIAYHAGRFLVVGGLPPGTNENYLYEYDPSLKFRKRHVLDSGYTLMGIQTATYADGFWWFGCYGKPQTVLKVTADFELVGHFKFDASLGIVGLPNGELLVARGRCQQGEGCTGRVVRAAPDSESGLVIGAPE